MGDHTMTAKQQLFTILDNLPERDISGWQLFSMMDGYNYPTTLLQYAREYCDLSGAILTMVDHQRSIYHFVPGAKIAGAIRD